MVTTGAGFGKSTRRYERSFVAHCDIAAGACPPRTEIVKVVDSVLHGGDDGRLDIDFLFSDIATSFLWLLLYFPFLYGCCHPPLADYAFCVPPVPGRPAPRSMEKIKLSCGHPQDD